MYLKAMVPNLHIDNIEISKGETKAGTSSPINASMEYIS